jgi:hypothetical protein
MKIAGVVISCFRNDVHLTRTCVASVRFWYPKIPIWLLKDRQHGEFSTAEMERHWGLQVLPGRAKNLGWGFGKLELVTESPRRRLLLLDSDTAFAGRVLDRLESFQEDLIVDKEEFPAEAIAVQFFPVERLSELDPEFVFPGYGFNTGQFVTTTGCLSRSDFDGLLDWESRTVLRRDIFQKGEQGLFNYVVLRKAQRGELSLRREPFMVWPGELKRAQHIQVSDLTASCPHAQVIHWAGLGWGKAIEEMPRADILQHFENLYYSRIPFGAAVRQYRRARFLAERGLVRPLKGAARQILGKSR